MQQKYYSIQNCKEGMIQGEAVKATRLQIERLHSFPFRIAVFGRNHDDDDGDYDCEALWHKEKTLPKAQRTQSIEYFKQLNESRSNSCLVLFDKG